MALTQPDKAERRSLVRTRFCRRRALACARTRERRRPRNHTSSPVTDYSPRRVTASGRAAKLTVPAEPRLLIGSPEVRARRCSAGRSALLPAALGVRSEQSRFATNARIRPNGGCP